MGKISPVSSKYIVHASIEIEGVVDRPDVIGAIFGQTEGLLGSDLELRELQRSGRIGRIEVNVDTRNGKTTGSIIIPSSLDKAETSIVGASLEIIQRIGPCNSKIKVGSIEDVRVSKREFVIGRAKELLRQMIDTVTPDSQELADEVAYSVRVMEIQEYGKERLPAGPAIDESEEILVVEGRADVLNLLKHGFKNAIAMNGTSVPQTIIELTKQKVVTAFVDGDRGGKLILRDLITVGDVDFIAIAPDGKEVEEITKKEIHKAIRSKVSPEQMKGELSKSVDRIEKSNFSTPRNDTRRSAPVRTAEPLRTAEPVGGAVRSAAPVRAGTLRRPQAPLRSVAPVPTRAATPANEKEKVAFKGMLENLVGTRGAHIIDEKLNILGKVPLSELQTTLKSLSSGVHAIVFDGSIERDVVKAAELSNVKFLVGMDTKVKPTDTKISLLTASEL